MMVLPTPGAKTLMAATVRSHPLVHLVGTSRRHVAVVVEQLKTEVVVMFPVIRMLPRQIHSRVLKKQLIFKMYLLICRNGYVTKIGEDNYEC